jgi:UDP-glucose 4-epimerase
LIEKFSRVLVAGGAGFIGSHIVDRLLEAGIEVIVLDNLFAGKMENIEQHMKNANFRFVKGDIRNSQLVRKIVKNVDAVFNDAAVVSVPRSVKKPLLANDVNVKGALTLLKASLDSKVKRFVQASSASIYGDTSTLPINEDMCPQPISPYAVSELAAENYARVFCSVYGLRTACLRYFNVYGPRQTYSQYSGVITVFAKQLLQDQSPKIYGDGEQTRDFVFVEDVVQANMLALEKSSAIGETFNIATGRPTTINKLVETLQKTMNKTNLKAIRKEALKGDIRHSYASIEKARKTLGYSPKFSLQEGLKKLTESYVSKPG